MGQSRNEYQVRAGSTRSCVYYRKRDAFHFARSLGARVAERDPVTKPDGSVEWYGYESKTSTEPMCVVVQLAPRGAS